MQENFDKQLQNIADIELEIRVNISHAKNRLNEISAVAAAELSGFKDGKIFTQRDKYVEELKKLTKQTDEFNQKFEELQRTTPSDSKNYLKKLELLTEEYKYINIDITNLLGDLNQFGNEVSLLANQRFQEKQSVYDGAKTALEKEISAVREVNQPIAGYIQRIEATIQDLEKNGVEPSLLTTCKNVLQSTQNSIQQILGEVDSADKKIQALISNPPTAPTIVAETKAIRDTIAKLKSANKPLTENDYDQLDMTDRLTSVVKYSSDLGAALNEIETKISSNLNHLDIETATDEAAKSLGRQTIAQKVELEKEKKNLQELNEEIKVLNDYASSQNLQDAKVIQEIRNSINVLSQQISQIGESIPPIQKNVEDIAKQVHERNIKPINALKQRLEQIKAKRDESNQLGYVDHEKEINEKIQDFNDQCRELEDNFDNLTRTDQKSKIEKLESLVHEIEGFISGRYHLMADFFKDFEDGSKKLQVAITQKQEAITHITSAKEASNARHAEIVREMEDNDHEARSKSHTEDRILALEKALGFGHADRVDPLILGPKTDRLDSNVQKLKEDVNKFVTELNDFIQIIEKELANGAVGQQISETVQNAFGVLAGPEYAKDIGVEWGINEENERRNKITNVLKEAKEIRDELLTLKSDENRSGKLSKETYAKTEQLIKRLNEKVTTLNQLITGAQEGISQIEAGMRKLLGQTSVKKEASAFDKVMQGLCLRASKLLKRMQLQSDYRDWRAFQDVEPNRLSNRARLEDEQKKTCR